MTTTLTYFLNKSLTKVVKNLKSSSKKKLVYVSTTRENLLEYRGTIL